jgi:hypothetical protein
MDEIDSDIADFLQRLGLEALISQFQEQGMELATLPQLLEGGDSDAHNFLKELGVARMGDRLKILKAIKDMAGSSSSLPSGGQPKTKPGPETTGSKRPKTGEGMDNFRSKFKASDSGSRFPRPQDVSKSPIGGRPSNLQRKEEDGRSKARCHNGGQKWEGQELGLLVPNPRHSQIPEVS